MLPAHRVYLETHFGSGAVFFRKALARVETINDADGEIANLHRVLRDPGLREWLVEAVEMTPWAEEELAEACESACESASEVDAVERARRLVVRAHMNVGSRQVGAAHFRFAGPASQMVPAAAWARLPESMRAAGERLRGVQVLCRDAVQAIRSHAASDVLVYADPPYPRSARSKGSALYRREMTDEDHEELLEALGAHPGPVALSGYRCGMYDAALADWSRVELPGRSHRHAAKEEETLWLNGVAESRREETLW